MSIGLKALIIIIFGISLISCLLDIFEVSKMMEDNFSTVRTANENALYLLNDEEINNIEMLNNWLYCFAEDNNMVFDELSIKFMSVGSNPGHYVVYIEGHNNYITISKDVYSAFKNSSAIVETEVNKN